MNNELILVILCHLQGMALGIKAPFVIFQNYVRIFWITSIFDKCHPSQGVLTPVEYESDIWQVNNV